MAVNTDIDIDLGDRNKALALLKHVPASIIKQDTKKHNSGVYFTDVPINPLTGTASIDYNVAEERGYFKIDLLNMSVYEQVRDEKHLLELMKEPDWALLQDEEFCKKVVHLGNHYDIIKTLKPDSIPRLAMTLAIIRPGKRHLLGKTWKEIADSIWDKSTDNEGFSFKKSHSIGYSLLVVVHMNLLSTNAN